MKIKDIMPIVYEEMEVFYAMCLASTLVSTYNSKESDQDSRKIIAFLGEAFRIPRETVSIFETCILEEMMHIGLITDYHALSATDLLSEHDKEYIELYEIKGRVLEEIALSEAKNYGVSDIRVVNQIRANMKYEYFHHPYNAKARFWQLARLSESGNVNVTRQVGMLYALGIGCDTDFQKAEETLLKCVLWGDKISAMLLKQLHCWMKKEDSEVDEYHHLINLLRCFIIAPKKDPLINHELANVLIGNQLSYKQKVELISNFNEKTWHCALLLDEGTERKIGFKVRKNE